VWLTPHLRDLIQPEGGESEIHDYWRLLVEKLCGSNSLNYILREMASKYDTGGSTAHQFYAKPISSDLSYIEAKIYYTGFPNSITMTDLLST